MALFTDIEPDLPEPRGRRRRVGWIILGLTLVGLLIVSLVPSPYVIEQPGPVFNTIGSVEYKTGIKPLIEIKDAQTYPTGGKLDMLTVNIAGNRDQPASWGEIANAWLDPSRAVVPLDLIYPQGQTVQDSNAENEADMANSQQDATAAALYYLGRKFSTVVTVEDLVKKYPASASLKIGDTLVSVNGKTFVDTYQLREVIRKNGTSTPLTVIVSRAGKQITAKLTPILSPQPDATPVLGVVTAAKYSFPIRVKVQLQDVGGPSAGMMFALGIIDKLTPGKLNGGKAIAGTGTISASGVVGPIGGIRQKMYGALRAGAKYFLAPKDDCDEVVGHIPSGLQVFSVSKLTDSVRALQAISAGTGTDALPRCTKP